MNKKPKILVVLGPTASGKSNLAVKLAKKLARTNWGGFNGAEIISADSRQVYKGLDIGTGKITKKEMQGIPHHLLDVENPKKIFTVAKFKELGEKAIEEILSRGKLPIICGGTGFYIDALVNDVNFPEVLPDKKLRAKLAKKSAGELFQLLKKLAPERAANIDPQNSRRLIRAIEIATKLGSVPFLETQSPNLGTEFPSKYDVLEIGIKTDDKILKEKILIRLFARISRGMINEAKKLHEKGLSWKRMHELGLEYRYLSKYLRKYPRLSASSPQVSALIAELGVAIWHYARRQKTWFKRDKKIKWFGIDELKKIEREVKDFLL